ncbi:F-box domain-containing protein [Mycena chlorophos]|uniref:F-box domain-containing protein n=1 Tax=Mycena chlorophos TaxID=658473 RepID=A0A8H6S7F1_MYCCL|nr:F-box domain-containing protein [Mycena chlorophos]
MLDVLPLELVVEIFRLCLPEGGCFSGYYYRHEGPVLLAQICSSWRQVALSTPSLWSKFDVIFGVDPPRAAHLAQLWLPRSDSYPLDLRISFFLDEVQPRHQSTLEHNLAAFLQTIKEHAHHTRNFDLADITLPELVRFEKEGMFFPMVESLRVVLHDWGLDDDDSEWPMMASFASARSLRKLHLEYFTLSRLEAPLENITDVIAMSQNLQQTIYMLAHLPALEHMDLQSIVIGAETHLPYLDAPIVLPRLSSFEMSCDFAQHLLPLLTLPALKELIVSRSDGLSCSMIESLLDRSLCSLKRLQLWPGGVQELPSVSAFKQSSLMMLEELSIDCPEERSLRRFCDAYGTDATFMPKLRTLEFLCGSHPPGARAAACLERLGPAVAARMANDEPLPLRALKVTWSEYDASLHGTQFDRRLRRFLQNRELRRLFTALKARGVEVFIGQDGNGKISWI